MAGEHAIERLGIGLAALAWLPVLQLLCYALLQLPAGALADRFGPRRVLTCALLLMGAGQLLLAFADSYAACMAARIVLGYGDAMTFVSVLRLIVVWCPATRVALLVQLTATLGMAGNVASAAPLLVLLTTAGWTPAFLIVALATTLVGGVLFAVVRDGAATVDAALPVRRSSWAADMWDGVAAAWRMPGVRLGMWMLFSRPAGRFRWHCWVLGLVTVVWAVVLGWPSDQVPVWLLGVLVGTLGLCGPASMLGADIARTASPVARAATATAVANSGGFAGSLIIILLIGVILDGASVTGMSQGAAFTLAFASQILLFALGAWRMWKWSAAR